MKLVSDTATPATCWTTGGVGGDRCLCSSYIEVTEQHTDVTDVNKFLHFFGKLFLIDLRHFRYNIPHQQKKYVNSAVQIAFISQLFARTFKNVANDRKHLRE